MVDPKTIIQIGIGLFLFFLLAATMVLPFFNTAYNFCQAKSWNCETGTSYANCTQRYQEAYNTTVVSGTTYLNDPVTGSICLKECLNCDTRGGYFATNQGLTLLVLVMALLGIGMAFFKLR